MKRVFPILIVFFIYSCSQVKELTPFPYLHNPIDSSKIRFDGFYSAIDTTTLPNGNKRSEVYTSQNEVVFCLNKKQYISNGASVSNEALTCDFYRNISSELLGEFTIKGNEIYSYSPLYFVMYGSFSKIHYAHFKGYIKNRDTIVDWKIVPPYPKNIGNWEINHPRNKFQFMPKTLYFVKTDAVKCLDK